MKKKIFIVIILLLAIGASGYLYMYKGHRDISSEDAIAVVSVTDLQAEFSKNDNLANGKYLDKTIVVSGKITSVEKETHSIVIDEKVTAIFQDSTQTVSASGKTIKIKGRFLGYDDLLEEFKMDQAAVIE